MMTLRIIISLFLASLAFGQSQIDLSQQARNPDFSALAHTRPIHVGTALPATCGVGELFFNSAATAGNNIYVCTSSNTWSPTGSGSLGDCTVTDDNLSCPGDVLSGTGNLAGILYLYETAANGGNSVSVAAPDSITAAYTLKLPGSGPQSGQALIFAAPDSSGVAQAAWGSGQTGPVTQVSLYATSGNTSNSISLAAPASIAATYTLQLPGSQPLSGQALAFTAPDSNGISQGSWQTASAGGGSASVLAGTYAGLPATCVEGNAYFFTDSLYTLARCTSGAWLHFFDGKTITPPSVLAPQTLVASTDATLNITHGYEQIVAPAGSGIMLRSWAAPSLAPYTKYIVLRAPALLDELNYRLWYVGFADASGKSHVLGCGVGQAQIGVFWCRVTRLDASGNYVSEDGSYIFGTVLSGTVIVAIENDGSLLHFGISTDGTSFFEMDSEPVASYLSSPSQLVYGFLNSASGPSVALDFLGVL